MTETRRGRPRATSRTEIARTALALFTERGYETTTMEQVAEAVGINRSTLFRYFDSKGAIVWEGRDRVEAGFAIALAAAPDTGPWFDPLIDALADAPVIPDGDVGFLRMQLRLIGSVPELRTLLAAATEPMVDATAAYLARRFGGSPTDLAPQSLARMAWAATIAGLMWWAEQGDGDPRRAIRDAVALLRQDPPPL